jgi:hypothetical protein
MGGRVGSISGGIASGKKVTRGRTRLSSEDRLEAQSLRRLARLSLSSL